MLHEYQLYLYKTLRYYINNILNLCISNWVLCFNWDGVLGMPATGSSPSSGPVGMRQHKKVHSMAVELHCHFTQPYSFLEAICHFCTKGTLFCWGSLGNGSNHHPTRMDRKPSDQATTPTKNSYTAWTEQQQWPELKMSLPINPFSLQIPHRFYLPWLPFFLFIRSKASIRLQPYLSRTHAGDWYPHVKPFSMPSSFPRARYASDKLKVEGGGGAGFGTGRCGHKSMWWFVGYRPP